MKRLPFLPLLAIATLVASCGSAADSAPGGASADAAAIDAAAVDADAIDFQGDFRGPLGLQLYSVRREMEQDVPGTLERVRALGIREVELAGTYGLSPEQFRQELDRVGLTATSMHAGYDRLRDDLPGVLAEARALGVQYVGTAWIPHPRGEFTTELARQSAADFNRWGQAARAEGIQVFYHIHGYEFQPDAEGVLPMDVLLRETDPDNVVFQLDTFWATLPGVDPAALLRQYPDRWKLMHLKDMRAGTPVNDHSGGAPADETQVPVGTGQIDFPALLRAAQEIGVDRYYLEDETSEPFEGVAQSIQYLQTVRF
jgi:sugar phosphate isomerase/epimerase